MDSKGLKHQSIYFGESDLEGLDVLLREVAQKNRKALAALYDSTNHLVYGLLTKMMADRALAGEVLVRTYERIWSQASEYNGDKRRALVWILGIARTIALKETRRRPAPRLEQAIPSENTLTSDALSGLPYQQRRGIELAYFSGWSVEEIASEMMLSPATVKKNLVQGMMKLRELAAAATAK